MCRSEADSSLSGETVAYWFFRLNCCFTTLNFVVHPDRPGSQRTDADVLAVRFPHRCELVTSGTPLPDHPLFAGSDHIDLVIAEVKEGQCSINGPWTQQHLMNVNRTLYAMGAFPKCYADAVAHKLYREYIYEDDEFRVRLFALGSRKNSRLDPAVEQLTWHDDVLAFIFRRFHDNDEYKSQHDQWDSVGKELYDRAQHHAHEGRFVEDVLQSMGLT